MTLKSAAAGLGLGRAAAVVMACLLMVPLGEEKMAGFRFTFGMTFQLSIFGHLRDAVSILPSFKQPKAALMQSFDNLNKWSSQLYREQKASAVLARGDDPEASWFEGQIAFIYIMPLARKLAEPGIFDDETGKLFARCVQDNRARWLIEGRLKTENLIANWNEKHTKSNR